MSKRRVGFYCPPFFGLPEPHDSVRWALVAHADAADRE